MPCRRILLHICCGPCLIYPLNLLRRKGFEVEGLFFNPNIHPFAEYKNRLQAVKKYAEIQKLKLHIGGYDIKYFFNTINDKEETPHRCILCWKMRLEESAKVAKENNCDYFSTTLLVSPYQDQNLLKQIGSEAERQSGVRFFCEDFRSGFRQAHNQAKQSGMYCQRYCGCLYSEMERYHCD